MISSYEGDLSSWQAVGGSETVAIAWLKNNKTSHIRAWLESDMRSQSQQFWRQHQSYVQEARQPDHAIP